MVLGIMRVVLWRKARFLILIRGIFPIMVLVVTLKLVVILLWKNMQNFMVNCGSKQAIQR